MPAALEFPVWTRQVSDSRRPSGEVRAGSLGRRDWRGRSRWPAGTGGKLRESPGSLSRGHGKVKRERHLSAFTWSCFCVSAGDENIRWNIPEIHILAVFNHVSSTMKIYSVSCHHLVRLELPLWAMLLPAQQPCWLLILTITDSECSWHMNFIYILSNGSRVSLCGRSMCPKEMR